MEIKEILWLSPSHYIKGRDIHKRAWTWCHVPVKPAYGRQKQEDVGAEVSKKRKGGKEISKEIEYSRVLSTIIR